MFRRSNSSSNIPLLKANLFGRKDITNKEHGGKRSQSTSRLSQRDSLAPVLQSRQSRKSSLERRSRNLLGLTRTTPLNRDENRPSLRRTTPSSAISQRTNSSRGNTPSSCLKDRKTIQKLATDKKWVVEQYVKVQSFITYSSLFDLAIVNTNNIKPPTLNTFVYVTKQLFTEIFPKFNMNNQNYKEVIATHLKVLHYPGTFPPSVLKTVNTMHSWPQVIGFWSWLIDKVNLISCSDDESLNDHSQSEEKQNHLLEQIVWDCSINRYQIFNGCEQSTEEVEKVHEKYVNNLAEVLGVDIEYFDQLKTNIEERKEYKNRQTLDIESIKSEKLRIQSEIEQWNKDSEEFQEADDVKQSELDKHLEIIQINMTDLKQAIEATGRDIVQLKEDIKMQPCTYQVKVDLLHQIENLMDDIKVKKDKIEHAQKIKSQFDHTLTSKINKMQTIVIEWNRSLMEMSIKKPELKKLLLREKGFHLPEFLNELQEISSCKVTIENEISKALVKEANKLKEEEQKKEEIEEQIKELIQIIDLMNQEYLKFKEEITSIKKDMKNITLDLEEKSKLHNEHMKKLQEDIKIKEQISIITEQKNNKDNLNLNVKKYGQKMLSFFIELQNQVTNNVIKMDGVRKIVQTNFEERVASVLEQQKQHITYSSNLSITD